MDVRRFRMSGPVVGVWQLLLVIRIFFLKKSLTYVVERLPSNHKALPPNPSTTRGKKNKKQTKQKNTCLAHS
jgi:hypothetical protein